MKKLIGLTLILILCSCAKTIVKTVKVDSFCAGKYEPLYLDESDFDLISELFFSQKYDSLITKYIDNHAINGREYKRCKN